MIEAIHWAALFLALWLAIIATRLHRVDDPHLRRRAARTILVLALFALTVSTVTFILSLL